MINLVELSSKQLPPQEMALAIHKSNPNKQEARLKNWLFNGLDRKKFQIQNKSNYFFVRLLSFWIRFGCCNSSLKSSVQNEKIEVCYLWLCLTSMAEPYKQPSEASERPFVLWRRTHGIRCARRGHLDLTIWTPNVGLVKVKSFTFDGFDWYHTLPFFNFPPCIYILQYKPSMMSQLKVPGMPPRKAPKASR